MSASRPTPDVTIIGGGIIGTALAWELAGRGVSVQLLERREIGREASGASAGIISSPGPRHGTRVNLALAAFQRYPSLIAEVEEASGISAGYVHSGQIDLIDETRGGALDEVLAWQQANGVEAYRLDRAAISEREPAADERFTGGVYVPGAGSVILGRLAVALARAAQRRGARVREHTPIGSIVLERGKATAVQTFSGTLPAGTVVIAAGAWSRLLGESIDLAVPTNPVKGQMMAIADPPVPIQSVLTAGHGYLVPRADGSIAVGATEEHDAGFDYRVTPAGLVELAGIVEGIAPSLLGGRFVEAWSGLRPGSDDGELIVGRAPHADNIWIATGHFRSGALLAPATAELLAESILTGQVDARLAPFDPVRFAR